MESKRDRVNHDNKINIVTFKTRTPDVTPNVLLLLFGKIETIALVDSGCSYVMIDEAHYDFIVTKYPFIRRYEKQAKHLGERFLLAAGKTHPEITRTSVLEFAFANKSKKRTIYRIAVLVVKDLTSQMILGRSLLRDLAAKVDLQNNQIRITEPAGRAKRRVVIPFYYDRTPSQKFRNEIKTKIALNDDNDDSDGVESRMSNLELATWEDSRPRIE